MLGPAVRHGRTRDAIVAAMIYVLASCSPVTPRTIEGGLDQLRVTVIDQSGSLRDVGFRGVSQLPVLEPPTNPPDQADVVWIGWSTRRCGYSTIVIDVDGDRPGRPARLTFARSETYVRARTTQTCSRP